MGGVFINYRRGRHIDIVQDLYERLARHFGEEQVFLDTSSIVPGQRYPDELRERVGDCEVLLVVVHDGWVDERDESGARRLDDQEYWVRKEIELALQTGKTIIPLLLDDAEAPKAEELPEAMCELANRQAEFLNDHQRHSDLAKLIAVLESHVAPTWQPIQPSEPRRTRPGQWLGVATGALAAVVLVVVPMLASDDSSARAGEVPFVFFAAMWSILLMCAPLVAVSVVSCPLRRSVNTWERELHTLQHQTYVRQMYPVPVMLVLVALSGTVTLMDHGIEKSLVLLLVVSVSVFHTAAANVRAKRKDKDQWVRWPQGLPTPVPRPVLRRAIARLKLRVDEWSRPLTREQREKAQWVLADLDRSLMGLRRKARRSRSEWLRHDHPWLLSLYVLWVTLNTALAFASALTVNATETGVWRMYTALMVTALISVAVSLSTMEVAYRHQRWQCRTLLREAAKRTDLLVQRVAKLSSPARTRPSVPVPRPEHGEEPD